MDHASPRPLRPGPRAVIVSGVAGSGKTTIGRALAERLGWAFVDGDDHHAPADVHGMARGEGLDDRARLPWLARVRTAMDERLAAGGGVVVACSALRRAHREMLRGGRSEVLVVQLQVRPTMLLARLEARSGHFAGAALLPSQLAALEPLAPGEAGRPVDAEGDAAEVAAQLVQVVLRAELESRPNSG